MRELHAILDAWRGLEAKDSDAVLATVVHVSGSAYRRPGARMLIVPGGGRVGCISGGCLEGEIVSKAWWFTESGAPVMRVYDTTAEDDAVWEFGLGCNGVVHVMLERVNAPTTRGMLEFLDDHQVARKPAVAATIVRTDAGSGMDVGDRLWIDEACVPGEVLPDAPLNRRFWFTPPPLFARGRAAWYIWARPTCSWNGLDRLCGW